MRIDEKPTVVQPGAFSKGETKIEESSKLDVSEEGGHVIEMRGGASLSKVVDALNLLGVGPSDLVEILQALKEAGALKAEMVVL